jgi:hypothetical protein
MGPDGGRQTRRSEVQARPIKTAMLIDSGGCVQTRVELSLFGGAVQRQDGGSPP